MINMLEAADFLQNLSCLLSSSIICSFQEWSKPIFPRVTILEGCFEFMVVDICLKKICPLEGAKPKLQIVSMDLASCSSASVLRVVDLRKPTNLFPTFYNSYGSERVLQTFHIFLQYFVIVFQRRLPNKASSISFSLHCFETILFCSFPIIS